jgi:membrane protease YdiL (CAAX protease family)
METENLGKRMLDFSLTRIIIGIIVVCGIARIGQIVTGTLLGLTTLDMDIKNLLIGVVVAVLSILSYILLFRKYENRDVTEISSKGLGKNLIVGILLGVILQSLPIGVFYLKGKFPIVEINPEISLLLSLGIAFTAAIYEEIVFRGIVFRILQEKLGSYIALALSALIFGVLNLSNPNDSAILAFGLAVETGLLFGAAYIYSGNLWFPIAINFAWNFTQSGIFGTVMSGSSVGQSLFTTKIKGAAWLTGGHFGPEGSVQSIIICLAAIIVLLILSHKKYNILRPYWMLK